MKHLFISVIFTFLIFACQSSKEANLIILIDNNMVDSAQTKLEIKINNKIVFDGFVEWFDLADKCSIYKYHLEPGENRIHISVPKHNINDELTFDLDSVAAIAVNLHYEPILDKQLPMEVREKLETDPSIQIRKYNTADIGQYESLDCVLLNARNK